MRLAASRNHRQFRLSCISGTAERAGAPQPASRGAGGALAMRRRTSRKSHNSPSCAGQSVGQTLRHELNGHSLLCAVGRSARGGYGGLTTRHATDGELRRGPRFDVRATLSGCRGHVGHVDGGRFDERQPASRSLRVRDWFATTRHEPEQATSESSAKCNGHTTRRSGARKPHEWRRSPEIVR